MRRCDSEMPNKSDALPIVSIMVGMVAGIGFDKVIPDRSLATALMVISIGAGFIFALFYDVVLQQIVVTYSYAGMQVRRDSKPKHPTLPLWYSHFECTEIVPNKIYSTVFHLIKNVKFPVYGKSKLCCVISEKKAEDWIDYGTGLASYDGVLLTHGRVMKFTVGEYDDASFSLERTNPMPVYYLREGPGYNMPKFAPDSIIAKYNRDDLLLAYQAQKMKAGEYKRQAMANYKDMIHAQEIVIYLKNEIEALLKTRKTIQQLALVYMMAVQKFELTIENGIKSQAKKLPFRLDWKALVVIAGIVAAVAVIYMVGPKGLQQFQYFLQSPLNMVAVTAIILGIVGGFVYWLMKRRG